MRSAAAEPVDPFVPPPTAHHAVVPGGEVFLWQPYPTIVLQKARGVMSRELAVSLWRLWQQTLSPALHCRVFADFEELVGYTRDARELQAALTIENREAVAAVHVLISSRDLALGIGAYKHDVGDQLVHTYAERSSLIRSYEDAVRELLH